MRTGENSLTTKTNVKAGLFLNRMQLFYELFPYPNRPFFMKPRPQGSIEAHAGTSLLIAQSAKNDHSIQIKNIRLNDAREAFHPEKRIALVGCGTDEPLLFRVLHPQNTIVAFDLSNRSLQQAARKLRWHRLKPVTFVYGDAQIALQKQSHFDHIQCFGVLHHQPEPENLIKAMADALNFGGTLRLMIYSCTGRRLERGLQKKFNSLWNHCVPTGTLPEIKPRISMTSLKLISASMKLFLWRAILPLNRSAAKSGRFRYIGLSLARVADALLHPSDHPLSLETTLKCARQHGLEIIAFKAKSYDLGEINSHASPSVSLQTLVNEEKRGNISTNIVLVFTKVGNS